MPNFSFRQLLPASVCFRQLPWTSVSTNIAQFRQHDMCEGGSGSQSSWATFQLKFQFSVLFCPILAPISCRGLQWTSVAAYMFNSDNMTCERGSGGQSFWATFQGKFQFAGLFCPILASGGFRPLPSASVVFRGLSSPHILFNSYNMTCGRGPEAKVSGPLFSLYFRCQCCFPNFCIRQLP